MKDEALKLALEALEEISSHYLSLRKSLLKKGCMALAAIEERLAQPDPSAYWHSEFLKYNTTSDHRMMENAQGDLERIKLVQTGVGIGKPEQEPVAYSYTSRITGAQGFSHHPMPRFIDSESWDIQPLYTSPPASKPWVGLTDETIIKIGNNCRLKAKPTSTGIIIHPDGMKEFGRAIEAKLWEKNT